MRVLSLFIVILFGFSQGFAQECPIEFQQLIPDKPEAKFTGFGRSMDMWGDYLVVGEPFNDSLEYKTGLVHVYHLDSQNKWVEQAVLSPSNPKLRMDFGFELTIEDNTIVARATYVTTVGQFHDVLYVFTKNSVDDWVSTTEDYIIDLVPDLTQEYPISITAVDMKDNRLAVSYYDQTESGSKIYNNSTGILSLETEFITPLDITNRKNGFWTDIALGSDFLAISAPEFQVSYPDEIGVVFIYNYDPSGGWNDLPVATLQPSLADQRTFGIDLQVVNNTLFVANGYDFSDGVNYTPRVFIYDKPATGWADSFEMAILNTGYPQDVSSFSTMVASEDYVFICTPSSPTPVAGFKKNVTWQDSDPTFTIPNPIIDENDRRLFGQAMVINDNRIVISYPDNLITNDQSEPDLIYDYYEPSGDFENVTAPNQILNNVTFSGADSRFGISTSVFNGQMAVGSNGDDEKGQSTGAVYLYDRQGPNDAWIYQSKVVPPDGRGYDNFGYEVELSDDLLFVSSIFYDSMTGDEPTFGSMGKVYQYRKTPNGWSLEHEIVSPALTLSDNRNFQRHFGRHIAYSDGYVAISQYYTGTSETDGRVYIFKELPNTQGWDHIATLRPEEDIRGDFFGRQVLMNDSIIVIGTGNPEFTSSFQMKVFIYHKKSADWVDATEDARLAPLEKMPSSRFGFSFAMHENHIVVGAVNYHYNNSMFNAGRAYVFQEPDSGWYGTINERFILEPSMPEENNNFGYDVHIDGSTIMIGAPHSINGAGSIITTNNALGRFKPGRIYVFDRNLLSGTSKLNNEEYVISSPNPRWMDGYGMQIDKSLEQIFIGAAFDYNNSGNRAGSVYIFDVPLYAKDFETSICADDAIVQLEFSPPGGVWTGSGIVDAKQGLFDPSATSDLVNELIYSLNDCSTSIFVEVDRPVNIVDSSNEVEIICDNGQQLLFVNSNNENNTFEWFYRINSTEPFVALDSKNDSIVVEKVGLYQCYINSGSCQTEVMNFDVRKEEVDIVIAQPGIICSDAPFQLSATPTGGTWSGNGVSSDGIISPGQLGNGQHNFTYEVSLTECSFSSSLTVDIDLLPKPEIVSTDRLTCESDPVTLSIRNNDDFEVSWFRFVEGEITFINTNPELQVNNKGNYLAQISKNGCVTSSEPIEIDYRSDSLFVPNVITPNGDNDNDDFKILSTGLSDFEIKIANRWGNQIYRSDNSDFNWQATEQQSGIYYWSINYNSCNGTKKDAKGWVHVLK